MRTSKYGRASGGIIVFIKNSVAAGITRVLQDFEFAVSFELNSDFFHTECDLLFMFLYLPPLGSPRYTYEKNGIEILRQKIEEVKVCYPSHKLVLVGDLNARIGQEVDFIVDDGVEGMPNMDWYTKSEFNIPRQSRDLTVNTFGKTLLTLCKETNMCVLNGRSTRDPFGEFTYVSEQGQSVIDYIVTEINMFDKWLDFEVLKCDVSNHFPVTVKVKYWKEVTEPIIETTGLKQQIRIRWRDEYKDAFVTRLCDDVANSTLNDFQEILEENVNDAVKMLVDIYQRAAEQMVLKRSKSVSRVQNSQPEWWDRECDEAKRNKSVKLNSYRRSGSVYELNEFKEARTIFRRLCKRKIYVYKDRLRSDVDRSSCSPNEFWKIIKQLSNKRTNGPNIKADEWFMYFKRLLNQKVNIDLDFEQNVRQHLSDYENVGNVNEDANVLNEEITNEEILKCIQSLKIGKAAGEDGITAEMMRVSQDLVISHLKLLFNRILNTGVYPAQWSQAVLCPLHKIGSMTNPENFRGISLLSVIGKIFSKVINTRLIQWAESNNLQHEEQAGYKKGYSTVDQIFILQSLAQKYLCRPKGRYYVLLIDFSKAFDTIPHFLLWHKLINSGVQGKILRVLRSMYAQLKTCVRTPSGLTDFFACDIGIRQGCVLSPFLFALYIGELTDMMKRSGCQGVYLDENAPNVMILLFADDIVQGANTVGRLQKMINVLAEFCTKWGMKINLLKTKILVFRRGGIVKQTERWYFMGKPIEVVSFYKYLGIMFTPKLKWTLAKKTLASQASKALGLLYMYSYKCGHLPVNVMVKLFDSMVVPILLYGSEIWGSEYSESIENVQITFLKRILGVGTTTTNAVVLSEVGRYPLAIVYYKKCIQFWLKLLQMPENRLPRSCYSVLKTLDENGKWTWVTSVRNLLHELGFGYVWTAQGVGNENVFLSVFEERVREHFATNLTHTIQNSSKTAVYSTFKCVWGQEVYLQSVTILKHRVALSRLRLANHPLMIECGRHLNIEVAERVCALCGKMGYCVLEDEYHLVMCCPSYAGLREHYLGIHLPDKEHVQYCHFINLMSSQNIAIQQSLAAYVYHALSSRKSQVSLLFQ